MLFGIIGILAGLAVINHPLLSGILVPTILIATIGVMSICMGAIGMFYALKGDWGAAAFGLLSVIFGLLLLASPLLALSILTPLIGGLAIVGGIVAVYMAFKLK